MKNLSYRAPYFLHYTYWLLGIPWKISFGSFLFFFFRRKLLRFIFDSCYYGCLFSKMWIGQNETRKKKATTSKFLSCRTDQEDPILQTYPAWTRWMFWFGKFMFYNLIEMIWLGFPPSMIFLKSIPKYFALFEQFF